MANIVNVSDLGERMGNIGSLSDEQFEMLFQIVLFEKTRRHARGKIDREGSFEFTWKASATGRVMGGEVVPERINFKLWEGKTDSWGLPF